jgi:hypothetical protein
VQMWRFRRFYTEEMSVVMPAGSLGRHQARGIRLQVSGRGSDRLRSYHVTTGLPQPPEA